MIARLAARDGERGSQAERTADSRTWNVERFGFVCLSRKACSVFGMGLPSPLADLVTDLSIFDADFDCCRDALTIPLNWGEAYINPPAAAAAAAEAGGAAAAGGACVRAGDEVEAVAIVTACGGLVAILYSFIPIIIMQCKHWLSSIVDSDGCARATMTVAWATYSVPWRGEVGGAETYALLGYFW